MQNARINNNEYVFISLAAALLCERARARVAAAHSRRFFISAHTVRHTSLAQYNLIGGYIFRFRFPFFFQTRPRVRFLTNDE